MGLGGAFATQAAAGGQRAHPGHRWQPCRGPAASKGGIHNPTTPTPRPLTVCLGEAVPSDVALPPQNLLAPVQRRKQLVKRCDTAGAGATGRLKTGSTGHAQGAVNAGGRQRCTNAAATHPGGLGQLHCHMLTLLVRLLAGGKAAAVHACRAGRKWHKGRSETKGVQHCSPGSTPTRGPWQGSHRAAWFPLPSHRC